MTLDPIATLGESVLGVRLIEFRNTEDERGILSAAEFPGDLPFAPVRVFSVTKSPKGVRRGGHAHRTCHQLLIAMSGEITIEYDDFSGSHTGSLTDAQVGLYIPPLVWATQKYENEGAALIVLASHPYDVHDYIDSRYQARRLRELA